MAVGCFQQVLFAHFLLVILNVAKLECRESGSDVKVDWDFQAKSMGWSVKSAIFLALALASV